MKRYVIVSVLLTALIPLLIALSGCHKGMEGAVGDELLVDAGVGLGAGAPPAEEISCPEEAGDDFVCQGDISPEGKINCYAPSDVNLENPFVCQVLSYLKEEECPPLPGKRVPACVGLMPDAKAGFIYDYARLGEAIAGMEGVGENFRTNLTKAVDPMGLVDDVENVDSVCIACDYRSKASLDALKAQADTAGHPFATWPALMKVYGLCEEVLVVYSFKEGKENLMSELFADVPNENGIYNFPLAIKGSQSGNNVLFGTDTFLTSGLYRAGSPSETFLSKNIEYYLPAGLVFYTNKELGALIEAPGLIRILKFYTVVMPSQVIALAAQTDYMLTSIDVFDRQMKLAAGIYAVDKKSLARNFTVFDVEHLPAIMEGAKKLFQALAPGP